MERNQTILEIIQSAVPSWGKVNEESCKITRLTSNSSQVFLVETSELVFPTHLIFRFFCISDTLNPETSSNILKILSLSNLAPKIYTETPRYRLEEYLSGYRVLSIAEISELKIIRKISSKLRQFHSLVISDPPDQKSLVCIENPKKWRKSAKASLFPSNSQESVVNLSDSESNQISDALSKKYFEIFLSLLPSSSPIVFSHMDTSYLNFLYNDIKEEVYLLDFDYSGYSYRGFDIAMLLTDLNYDYSNPIPPYFRYLNSNFKGDEMLNECVKYYGGDSAMVEECKLCMIACHYIWAMWAFSMLGSSSGAMDMASYGLLRFSEFISSYESYKSGLNL